MIKKLDIQNFRGIRSGHLEDLRQFNLFVGPNNSGKSTVIEALYLAGTAGKKITLAVPLEGSTCYLAADTSSADLLGIAPLNRVLATHNFSERRNDLGNWSQGVIRVRLSKSTAPLASFELDTRTEQPFEAEEARQIGLFAFGPEPERMAETTRIAKDIIGNNSEPFVNRRIVYCWNSDLCHYDRSAAAWMVTGEPPTVEHTLLYSTGDYRHHIPIGFYQRALQNVLGWPQQIARRFGNVFGIDPNTFNVVFLPARDNSGLMQGWIAPIDRPALPVDTYGDGARAAFKILTSLIALVGMVTPEKPGMFLWEEPESFQNPRTLASLLNEVIDLVKNKPIQLFFSTHSLEVMAHFAKSLIEGRIPENNFIMFRFKLAEGELLTPWFNKENLVAWLESGRDPRLRGPFESPFQFKLFPVEEDL